MHKGDWDGASDLLRFLPDVFVSAWAWQPIELIEGWVYEGAGRHEEAQTAFQAAADRARDRLEVEPEDERARGSLALALAGLGDMDDAIRTAELAVERQPAFADVVQGPHRLFELAAIHARTGHVEEAVSVLETLLSTPNMYNAVRIEGEFLMRPLRGEPVFETLIERERARVF